jgi:uncharacterized membrane protein (TIGR02234 family)
VSARRRYLLTLLLGAAGAGAVLLAARQPWAHVVTRAPRPLPSASVAVSGQDLVPLAGALALAALAGLAAVIATRGAARQVVGALLVVFGAGIAVAVSLRLGAASVLAAAHSAGVPAAGSVTGGSGSGGGVVPGGAAPGLSTAGRVVLAALPWRGLALAGAVALATAGLLTAWQGPRWPAMSGRYEQPSARPARPVAADAAGIWESLSQGVDPTDDGAAGQAGPGTAG